MNILIACKAVIPAVAYGGIERVIWYLGKELLRLGHEVSFLALPGSKCDFAKVNFIDPSKDISSQIPDEIDLVHLHFATAEPITKPHITTMHVNYHDGSDMDLNTVFISKDHAGRFGSESFVYNGLDWDDYGNPDLHSDRNYFHFLGNAAWRLKNVQGAIDAILRTPEEQLRVLGGYRFNLKMGIRFTFSPRIKFHGMVGGEEKLKLLRHSKGLVFPVRWPEPFGLATIESLYFGCPVFATPYGALPELVTSDVGWLADNVTDLSNALLNAGNFSREKCHSYAADNFNSRKMALEYVNRYEAVLNGKTLNAIPPRLAKKQGSKFLKWSKN